MSKLRIEIRIEFSGEGQERDPMDLDILLNRENPSDAHIYDVITEHVCRHLEDCPRYEDQP
ncbi:hypothetical protein AH02_55 [Pseudomonas phage AH02]|nr:hypothetical protein AH02_55 [Pseudomonas phage AH02]